MGGVQSDEFRDDSPGFNPGGSYNTVCNSPVNEEEESSSSASYLATAVFSASSEDNRGSTDDVHGVSTCRTVACPGSAPIVGEASQIVWFGGPLEMR